VLKDESLEDSANLLDYPACPASLDILKISMPPAVKLAAVFSVPPTLDPDVIAAEIDSLVPTHSPFGLPVHVLRSRGLH
jgi:hypothetical protein